MKTDRILLCLCKPSGHEMEFIKAAFDDNWVVPLGPNVTGFENDLDKFLLSGEREYEIQLPSGKVSGDIKKFKEKRTLALSSGTAAIHLGLVMFGINPGDEIMVQSFTFSASANPAKYLGATPVFIDSEGETWNMNPEILDHAIADRIKKTGKKPKAIIPVCLYGMPPKMKEIMEVAAKWEIPVMEDAAEALGSRYRGQMCGTFGVYGALSFNGNKMITTSGGGALICPGKEEYEKALNFATQSREPFPWYQHERIGFNYRLSNISAGIGRGQMKVVEEYISHHKWVQSLYKKLFSEIPGINLHENPGSEFDSNFWVSAITLSPDVKVKGENELGKPEALRRHLDEAGIESRHLWKPMHLQPYFKDCPAYIDGTSERLFESGLCLPASPWVGKEEAYRITETIRSGLEMND